VVQALLFGLAASSALVIGGVVGAFWDLPPLLLRVLLAFGSGAMISALAFELFEEAFHLGGATRAGLGLLAGAATFVVLEMVTEGRLPRLHRGRPEQNRAAKRSVAGIPVLVAVILDGIPENTALGVTLIENSNAALLVAIFIGNLPESVAGAADMRGAKKSRGFILGIWTVAALVLVLAVVVGNVALENASPGTLSFLLSFAGGAVLAVVATTLLPNAFRPAPDDGPAGGFHPGHPANVLAVAAGFFLSFMLAEA
jgi:ZIP family zinc transporter